MTDPAETMRQLRELALRLSAAELEVTPTDERPNVWGAIMELGYPTGIATLVSLSEGTTSLYFSNGGGIIGAGEYPAVREAAERFLDIVEAFRAEFHPVRATPTPRIGRVRFYVRTFDETLGAEVMEDELSLESHPLAPVFQAGHGVLTAIRESSNPER